MQEADTNIFPLLLHNKFLHRQTIPIHQLAVPCGSDLDIRSNSFFLIIEYLDISTRPCSSSYLSSAHPAAFSGQP